MDVTDAVFAKKHKISIPRLSSKLQPFHHETIDMQIKWIGKGIKDKGIDNKSKKVLIEVNHYLSMKALRDKIK